MIIEGTYTLQAPPEDVWHYLTGQEMLSRVIPGAEHVERIDRDSYDITISIGQGPFKGAHHTHITLSEQQYPYHYRVAIESTGLKGFNGTGSFHLQRHHQSTIVAYKGTLNINKSMTFLTPKLVKGAAKHLIQQYFLALAHELRQQPHATPEVESLDKYNHNESRVIMTATAKEDTMQKTSTLTLLGRAIRLVRLGGKDTNMQLRWEKRIRLTGRISVLLFLIWLGTKIPRRFS